MGRTVTPEISAWLREFDEVVKPASVQDGPRLAGQPAPFPLMVTVPPMLPTPMASRSASA